MNQQNPNQFPNQPYPEDQYEMMQMRQAMRDGDHLNLMAILHYVWAGLVGLGAVFFIGYMVVMGAFFEQVMMSVPTSSTTPTSAPASTPPVQVLPSAPTEVPVNPDIPATGAPTSTTTTTTGSSGSTTFTTYSTGSSKAMVDSMIKMMYIFYGAMAALCLIGSICNILSARFMKRRKHRVFSMVIGAFNVVMVPLGTVLGIFTFIVLCRQSVAQMYSPADTLRQRDPR